MSMDNLGQLDIKALALARRSAAPKPWAITDVVELTREDMVLLASGDAPTDPKAPLARISAAHHYLAKFVAQGKGNVEISNITGYTPARISTLRKDPSFIDLVAHYEAEIVATSPDITARVTHLALGAAEILQERLDTDPDSFSKKELRELMAASLDRVGHGPTSKQVVQVNDPANVIRNLTQALQAENRGRIISREIIEADYSVSDSGSDSASKSDPDPDPDPGDLNESPAPCEGPTIRSDDGLGPIPKSVSDQTPPAGGRGDQIPKQSP